MQGDALNQAFTRFKELADRKVQITEADLEAIVAEELGGLVHRSTSCAELDLHGGTSTTPTATVVLDRRRRQDRGDATGDGMIDAARARRSGLRPGSTRHSSTSQSPR